MIGAIVTGGTSGIGAATVERLLAEGYRVLTFSPDEDAVAALSARLDRSSGALTTMVGDVADPDDIAAVVETARADFGGAPSVLVNNAAVRPIGPLTELRSDDLERAWSVNVRGAIELTTALLPDMVERSRGVIVNVVSGSGFGRPGLFAYCVSKAAMLGFTAAAAVDLAQYHIRVNNVLPGTTLTGMTADRHGEARDAMYDLAARNSVTGRPNDPREVAAAIAWLVSDDATAVSGTTIEVGTLPRFSR